MLKISKNLCAMLFALLLVFSTSTNIFAQSESVYTPQDEAIDRLSALTEEYDLKDISLSDIPLGVTPVEMSIDELERFLFEMNQTESITISANFSNNNSMLRAISGQEVSVGCNMPGSIVGTTATISLRAGYDLYSPDFYGPYLPGQVYISGAKYCSWSLSGSTSNMSLSNSSAPMPTLNGTTLCVSGSTDVDFYIFTSGLGFLRAYTKTAFISYNYHYDYGLTNVSSSYH